MTFPFRRIHHLLIDMDGVLYQGSTAIGGAPEFIAWLKERGLSFRLVTNNSTLTPEQYVAKMADLGMMVEPEQVFTSSMATALYLEHRCESRMSAYVIGEDGLRNALENIGIRLVESSPDWVVVGLDRRLTYDKLAQATLALRGGARFLATNADLSLPSERGLLPGAGSILAALVATTGIHPLVIGKPEATMLELAMQHLGASIEDTAMLGDRLDTDIQGAQALNMASILVLTGVSQRTELEGSPIQPSLVVDNLPELRALWQENSV